MELSEMTVRSFADLLGSDAPAPGGGSAAALAGSLGAALTAMVSSLTLSRKKYEQQADFAASVYQKADALKAAFLTAMQIDTEVFTHFSAALAMPKETEEQKQARSCAVQAALIDCTQSPLSMMELAVQSLELTASAIGKTNVLAASDLGVSALMLKAAIQSAWLNVLINIGSIKDKQQAELFRKQGEALLQKALPLADCIYAEIEASL